MKGSDPLTRPRPQPASTCSAAIRPLRAITEPPGVGGRAAEVQPSTGVRAWSRRSHICYGSAWPWKMWPPLRPIRDSMSGGPITWTSSMQSRRSGARTRDRVERHGPRSRRGANPSRPRRARRERTGRRRSSPRGRRGRRCGRRRSGSRARRSRSPGLAAARRLDRRLGGVDAVGDRDLRALRARSGGRSAEGREAVERDVELHHRRAHVPVLQALAVGGGNVGVARVEQARAGALGPRCRSLPAP